MKNLLFVSLILLFAAPAYSKVVEGSVIPLINDYEHLERLPAAKFSKNQLSEIKEALNQKEKRVRLVSFNMLFNLKDSTEAPAYRWHARVERIVELLQEMQPDIICAQELTLSQCSDLEKYLAEDFGLFGMNSEDITFNMIFYKKARFDLLQQESWKMTEPSEDLLSNALNMLQLYDKVSKRSFAVLNTQICFRSLDLRESQAHFIASSAKWLSKRMPVVAAGDFNTFPTRLDLRGLPFYDGDYVQRLITKECLKEAASCSLLGHLGPIATFTNLPEEKTPFKGTGTPGIFLDHVYVSEGISVLLHAVQPATVDGYFASDHMPVVVDFIVN